MSGSKVPKDLRDITPCWLTKAFNVSREPGGPSVTGYSAETIAEGKGFMNLWRQTGACEQPKAIPESWSRALGLRESAALNPSTPGLNHQKLRGALRDNHA